MIGIGVGSGLGLGVGVGLGVGMGGPGDGEGDCVGYASITVYVPAAVTSGGQDWPAAQSG